MIPNTNFYNNISEFRRDKSTILFTLAESDYLGFRHLCLLEQPAIGLILFAGQQAIEKYLKAIILLNDRPVNNLGHNLSDILTEALNSSQSLTSKNNRAFCETIITHFNNAENSRYASAHIIVDDMLHHKLDALVVETLRKSYIEDYMLIFGKDIDYKYLDLILENKEALPNSHNSLTYDNNSFGFKLNGTISVIRPIYYKLKTTVILNNLNFDTKTSLENNIGIKLSRDEFQKTLTLTPTELANEPEVLSDLDSFLSKRRA